MSLSYREQVLLTLLDKGLLALILIVAGFWLNWYLEKFKSRQQLENELRKVRDQKQIELLESQLSKFYWPVYLHLQMDNVVWQRILQKGSSDKLTADLSHRIETDFILPNHDATCTLIQANIHLAAPDSQLMKAVLKYLRHVTVYRALRATGNTSLDPINVDEPWPKDLFPAVEEATFRKQREFETLLQQNSNDCSHS
jgi:hypothetical protein